MTKVFLQKLFCLQLILTLVLSVTPTCFGISDPTLLEPADGNTIENATLKWQIVEGSTGYHVLIDDESSFSSPYIKSYNPNSNQYSPKLNPGKYFWKVSAKDSSGNWSDWSEVWSFIIGTQLSPSPSQKTTEPPSSPKNTPISTLTISNASSSINSDESFKITAAINSTPNTNFYLKGAFKKSNSSNYFGFTKINSDWIKNNESFSKQLAITTDAAGSWNGEVEIKTDPDDSGFTGSGDYLFKVARYSSSGSGLTWSNEVNIHINSVEMDSSERTPLPSRTEQPIPEVLGSTLSKEIEIPEFEDATASSETAVIIDEEPTAEPITDLPNVKTPEKSSFNFLFLIGSLFIIGPIGYLSFKFYKTRV